MRGSGVVIVGAGQAAFQAASQLRKEGYAEPIRILGQEPHAPYQRPPLSKGMLLGKQEARHAILRPPAFYEKQSIELIPGERVESLSLLNRRVTGSSGRDYLYDKLILATGARNRVLPIKGRDLLGVHYLRTLAEAEALHQHLDDAENVAVIGGGFIGLEVAAAAQQRGKNVTVVEAQPRLMERVVAEPISEYFLQRHQAAGVRVLLDASVELLAGEGKRVREVVLSDGGRVPADLVVIGIGVIPNAELAADAGLETHNGIVVNPYLETVDPHVFAVGDCAVYPNPFASPAVDPSEPLVRLESVQNAVDQATAVARTIAGARQKYRAVPWFWTTQFDVNLQMVGISAGHTDTVVRGDPASGRFSLFYYRDRALCSVDSINQPAEHLTARKLIDTDARISPEQASDPDFDLKSSLRPD